MGQAKQRGSFEERKASAIERNKQQYLARIELQRRKPSPQHIALITAISALARGAQKP